MQTLEKMFHLSSFTVSTMSLCFLHQRRSRRILITIPISRTCRVSSIIGHARALPMPARRRILRIRRHHHSAGVSLCLCLSRGARKCMYVSRGGHGIHDVPSSSVSFMGILKLERKEKREKRTPSRKLATQCVKGQKSVHTRLLVVRKRKRKREEEEERAPRFNNGVAFRARGERS